MQLLIYPRFYTHATCMCDCEFKASMCLSLITTLHLPCVIFHPNIKHPRIIYMYIYFNMYISSPGSPSSACHMKWWRCRLSWRGHYDNIISNVPPHLHTRRQTHTWIIPTVASKPNHTSQFWFIFVRFVYAIFCVLQTNI